MHGSARTRSTGPAALSWPRPAMDTPTPLPASPADSSAPPTPRLVTGPRGPDTHFEPFYAAEIAAAREPSDLRNNRLTSIRSARLRSAERSQHPPHRTPVYRATPRRCDDNDAVGAFGTGGELPTALSPSLTRAVRSLRSATVPWSSANRSATADRGMAPGR